MLRDAEVARVRPDGESCIWNRLGRELLSDERHPCVLLAVP